jgi:hypothetical protein
MLFDLEHALTGAPLLVVNVPSGTLEVASFLSVLALAAVACPTFLPNLIQVFDLGFNPVLLDITFRPWFLL